MKEPIFACDLEYIDIIKPDEITEIVSSKSFLDGKWLSKTKHKLFNEPELRKYFIPIDFSCYSLQLISIIEPGTIIPEHSHTETVYRYVLDGSFELNGLKFERDDWILVPKDYKYSIITETGYRVLSAYHAECQECQWHTLSKLPLGRIRP
ncbi:hypothetical protein XFLAVUS301_31470 [Xanthobacter flavus]|uniref:Cupin domain-containing protein n=1 Tax=Xanthobacter flavus TaxID=281 RepID=A0A9W6CJC4_XANFL|nr:hypothetical protein XFLAVUS301_31470 [Xanthobacter flavus]